MDINWGDNIRKLADLLREFKNDSREDDDEVKDSGPRSEFPTSSSSWTPGSVVSSVKPMVSKTIKKDKGRSSSPFDVNRPPSPEIWKLNEVEYEESEKCAKEEPEYEIRYCQDVTAEDVYFNLDGKIPAASSCDWLVKVRLPGITCRKEIRLKFLDQSLELSSPKHLLNIALPRRVDHTKCKSDWSKETETLSVRIGFSDEQLLLP